MLACCTHLLRQCGKEAKLVWLGPGARLPHQVYLSRRQVPVWRKLPKRGYSRASP